MEQWFLFFWQYFSKLKRIWVFNLVGSMNSKDHQIQQPEKRDKPTQTSSVENLRQKKWWVRLNCKMNFWERHAEIIKQWQSLMLPSKKDDLKHSIFVLLKSDWIRHLDDFKQCRLLMSWAWRLVEDREYSVALLVCIVMYLYSTHANYDHMLQPSVVYIIWFNFYPNFY